MSDYLLHFLNKRTHATGTITLTQADKENIHAFAVKHNLNPECTFTVVFRAMMTELSRQTTQPAPSPSPAPAVDPKPQIPEGHVLVKFTEKDKVCLEARMRKGRSENMSQMFRQAMNFLNTNPFGDIFSGRW